MTYQASPDTAVVEIQKALAVGEQVAAEIKRAVAAANASFHA